jgi:hypothetical protein
MPPLSTLLVVSGGVIVGAPIAEAPLYELDALNELSARAAESARTRGIGVVASSSVTPLALPDAGAGMRRCVGVSGRRGRVLVSPRGYSLALSCMGLSFHPETKRESCDG